MRWINSTEHDYDDRRVLFNAMIDKRPRLIAACDNAPDVKAALAKAQEDDLPIAVRSGGHSVAGWSTNDDGLIIDVRPMKAIEIDPQARRAKVGGGVTWAEFDAAAQLHGLAVTGGRASTTGVSGFTIGGGSGWLERQFGLACDNLVGLDIVTADGRELHTDTTENPDLLWAHRGGGGNFGVVTSLEFQLHQVGPTILGGLIIWPADRADEIARLWRGWAESSPPQLGTALAMLSAPPEEFVPPEFHFAPIIGIIVGWFGDAATGAELVQVLRDEEPVMDLVGEIPYVQLQSMIDDPWGNRQYWSADYHTEMSDDALDVWVQFGHNRPSGLTQQLLLNWSDAVTAVDPDSTPMTNRDAAWVSHPFAQWVEAADDEVNIGWVKDFRKAVSPYTSEGIYLNFIGDEGEDRVRSAFGAKYERLAAIKAEYDPGNVFAGNQNIRPSVDG